MQHWGPLGWFAVIVLSNQYAWLWGFLQASKKQFLELLQECEKKSHGTKEFKIGTREQSVTAQSPLGVSEVEVDKCKSNEKSKVGEEHMF